ncbi:MAG: beta-propeller domain-containing protein [Myxococcales bacterium]|nr:beta-propeller domain-containing protein [Myxococcales bacterium]
MTSLVRRCAPWCALLAALCLVACDSSAPSAAAPPAPAGPMGPDLPERVPLPPAGEAPGLDPAIFPAVGSSDFLSANENEQLSSGVGYRAGANGRATLDDADADGLAEGGEPGGAEPAPDPTREIVEADVFHLDGDMLYVLNRWRGLVIIDVSVPDAPRVRGRLPFQAVPVEMYVRDGRAYVLSSDYFTYWQYDPEADPHGFHGSQVMILDVEDPDAPTRLGGLEVEGEITDSRMVGDVLYTVSKRRPDYWRYNTADWADRTWVVSLNVADPQDIREIDRIEFDGTSTLIHVAHHAIFVAALDPNYYLTGPGFEAETLVTYVDISDPTGALAQRGRVYVPGYIPDKFKMDWDDGVFRAMSQRYNGAPGMTLSLVRTDRPDALEVDATLDIGLENGSLQASRFDGPRGFLWTARYDQASRQVMYHLHTLDLADPLAPAEAGRLRVDLATTHLEIHGDRLLALGARRVGNTQRTTLGLYDVADLARPAELALEEVGQGWSASEANWDYKALKTYPALGLILLPLQYWVRNGRSFNGVGLVDWVGDTLTSRGEVECVGGVRRAFPVGDRLVAVGELSVTTIDATDRDEPVATASLRLVRQVHDVFSVQGLQVQILTDIYTSELRLEVRAFGADDDTPAVASLVLPFRGLPTILRDGDALHLLGWDVEQSVQVIRNVDLSDPRAPRLRGELVVDQAAERIYNDGGGFYARYWSPAAGLPLNNQILPITYRRIVEDERGRRDFESTLRFLDLRDLDAPRVADGEVPMNDYPFVNKVTHGDVLFSSHVEQATTPEGASLLYHVRGYADRIDVSNPDAPRVLPSLNIPGYLVDVSDDGRLLYTVDYQWDDFGRRRNSLNVLRVADDDASAVLVEVIPVADQIARAALRPAWLSEGGRPAGWHDRTLWMTAHKYPWWGVRSDTVSSRQPYTVLRRVTLDPDGGLTSDSRHTLPGYHFDLLDVAEGEAWLASRGPYGLLALDVRDAADPAIRFAARTIGYLSRIVVDAGYAYAPMGMFGVHRYGLDL